MDYNIISNLRFDQHHWAHPEKRPRPRDRVPRQRKVPAMLHKELLGLDLGIFGAPTACETHGKGMGKACHMAPNGFRKAFEEQ